MATPEEIAARARALVRAAEEELRSLIGADRSAAYDAVEPLIAARPEDPAALDAINLVLRVGGCLPKPEVDAVDLAWEAIESGDLLAAGSYADELLDEASREDEVWNAANLLHAAHIIHGTANRRRGDLAEAARHLIAAGDVAGSPQLDSFGPDLSLAWSLLGTDYEKAVLQYLRSCSRFWSPSARP